MNGLGNSKTRRTTRSGTRESSLATRSLTTSTTTCDYCGLPISAGWLNAADAQAPAYCCYGCRFAAAVAQERGEVGQMRWNLTRLGLAIFFSMNVMVFTLVLWSLDVFPEAPARDTAQATLLWDLFRYLCMLFSLPVLLLLGGPLLENALLQLRRGSLGTDLLLVAGVVAAYLYSAVSVFQGRGHVYFEVGCMILVAVTLGRWLEATGKWKATDALKSLSKLLPPEVRILSEGRFITKQLADVQPGDELRVSAGERLPVDGAIIRGEAAVDEQIVTGESQPTVKQIGAAVHGGTLNLDGTLTIRATATADGGALQRLIDAVVASAAADDRWRRLADRVSAIFTPAVLVVSLATLAGHWWLNDFQSGLLAGLAVLLIACPCALGIATPLATWAAMGAASRSGVLFRNGDAIARLAGIRAICFDKTGTLTDGALTVEQVVVESETELQRVMRYAAILSEASNHVVSQAIKQYAHSSVVNPDAALAHSPRNVENIAGQGVACLVEGLSGAILLGSGRLMQRRGMEFGPRLRQAMSSAAADEQSCCYIAWDGQVSGVFLLRETMRPEAAEAVRQLQAGGIHVCVLTGDRDARGKRLARQLGVAVQAELLPEEKLAALQQIRAQHGAVAMVGDGLNDAPALAAADIGIALGCGADVSREAADVCLIRNNLADVPQAVHLARATARTIQQNLIWAFSYNTIGMLLAVSGWLNPMLAALAMALSSLLVVSNSLKLSSVGATAQISSDTPAAAAAEITLGDDIHRAPPAAEGAAV